jgi:divalent metal cation (Fe/Co/Zn/Cd) transporter
MVSITATLSFYFGYKEFSNPDPISHLPLAIFVLIFAVGSNGYSLRLSALKLLEGESLKKLPAMFIASPHIAPKTTFVLDAMGTLAAIFGLTALALYGITGNAKFDGIGAMMVGALLVIFAVVLLISVRGLVVGQSASREMERHIRDAVRDVPEVKHVVGLRTMMLGSDSMLVNIDVHLKDGLSTDQVEEVVEKIKEAAEKTGEGFTVHVEPDPEHHVGHH